MKPHWIAATLFLFVAACGEEKNPYQVPVPQTPAAHLFQNERQSLDKTRSIVQTLDANVREKTQKAEQK